MAEKLQARLNLEHLEFLLAEFEDASNAGECYVIHNKEIAQAFSPFLFEYYPQRICIEFRDRYLFAFNCNCLDHYYQKLLLYKSKLLNEIDNVESDLDFILDFLS